MEKTRDPREKPSFDVLSRVSKLRTERGWTEYELAQRAGITQSTIHGWYKRNLTPTLPLIEKICLGFGISLSEFFNYSNKQTFLTLEEADMLDLFQKLSPEQRKTTLAMIRSYIKA